MDETVAKLVQPYVADDTSWVLFTTAASRRFRQFLDLDSGWEGHFGIKCADIQSLLAHFRFYRHIECRHLAYDLSHVWGQYSINISVKTDRPFASQAFPQLFLIERLLDEHFSEVTL